jgi:purine-binding chemotaxis protein CheW
MTTSIEYNQKQFATFTVGNLLFGIPVHEVQEILRYQNLTPVPLSSPIIKGLLNLRGQIITAIDMRKRLSVPEEVPDQHCMNVIIDSEDQRISLVVDAVGDVLELEPSAFEPLPATVNADLRNLSKGVYKLTDKVLLVLNTRAALEF